MKNQYIDFVIYDKCQYKMEQILHDCPHIVKLYIETYPSLPNHQLNHDLYNQISKENINDLYCHKLMAYSIGNIEFIQEHNCSFCVPSCDLVVINQQYELISWLNNNTNDKINNMLKILYGANIYNVYPVIKWMIHSYDDYMAHYYILFRKWYFTALENSVTKGCLENTIFMLDSTVKLFDMFINNYKDGYKDAFETACIKNIDMVIPFLRCGICFDVKSSCDLINAEIENFKNKVVRVKRARPNMYMG